MGTRLGLVWVMSLLALASCSGDPPVGTGTGTYTGDGDSGDGDSGDGDSGDGDSGDGDGDSGDGDNECGSIEQEAELTRGPVDIVWAIDSSGSMIDEFGRVMDNLAKFADNIEKSGANARVVNLNLFGVLLDPIAMSPFGMDANRYKFLPVDVDSHNALSVLLNQFDAYKSFLRPDAPTHFIVVSDDSSSMAAGTFKTQMEAKLGHEFYFHSIVADGLLGGSCSGSGSGEEYKVLSDMTTGQKLSICEADWNPIFMKLQSAVIASTPLPCDFAIPEPPQGQTTDTNRIQVFFTPAGEKDKSEFGKASKADACGQELAWSVDGERITFCPTACDLVKKGGSLSIGFGCMPNVIF